MVKKTSMGKKTRMGKIDVPLDIRDETAVPAFEKMLENGPMMVVLVYADWCGHCIKYKDNVWSPLKSVKNRTMNMASVHYDQLNNTSLKNSKIDGYPSLLVVGKDKTPATFKSPSGTTTNALPKANDFTTMKNLVTSPVLDKDEEEVMMDEPNSINTMNTMNKMNTLPKISSSLKPSTLETTNTNLSNTTNTNVLNTNTNVLNTNTNVLNTTNTNLSNTMNETVGNTIDETVGNTIDETVGNTIDDTMPVEENTSVPKISEDVVTLTNSMNVNTSAPPPATATTTTNARAPVTMMGGRLYRMLSLKKKRRASSKKRKTNRKTANF